MIRRFWRLAHRRRGGFQNCPEAASSKVPRLVTDNKIASFRGARTPSPDRQRLPARSGGFSAVPSPDCNCRMGRLPLPGGNPAALQKPPPRPCQPCASRCVSGNRTGLADCRNRASRCRPRQVSHRLREEKRDRREVARAPPMRRSARKNHELGAPPPPPPPPPDDGGAITALTVREAVLLVTVPAELLTVTV